MISPPSTIPGMSSQAEHSFAVASWIVFGVVCGPFILKIWHRRRRHHSSYRTPWRGAVSYDEYIHSARWRRKCNRYYARHGRRCHWPGCRSKAGNVHHLRYLHLQHERMRELTGLCVTHHHEIHRLFDVHDSAAFGDQLRFLRTPPRQLISQRRTP